MSSSLRVVLAAGGVDEFNALHGACVHAGHVPVAYVTSRSMRPGMPVDADAADSVATIIRGLPTGMDLLAPGTGGGLAQAIAGYSPDLLIVYGFNWRFTPEALAACRHGAINIHLSLLPRYRGPAPVLAAIRNGDPDIGLTVHRMDDDFDTGPVLVQRSGIRLDEQVRPGLLWSRVRPVLVEALTEALERVARGEHGELQDPRDASYAGFIEPEFRRIDWSRTAREIHNQVRVFAYIGAGGPVGAVKGQPMQILRTALTAGDGLRVECGDGPIWVLETAVDQSVPN